MSKLTKSLLLLLIITAVATMPVYAEGTISPNPIVKGQGVATLTVNVTNTGSLDTINVNVASANGATVTVITNSLRLAQGQKGTYTFLLNPTVSESSDVIIEVIAYAGGSGLQTREYFTLHVIVPPPDSTTIYGTIYDGDVPPTEPNRAPESWGVSALAILLIISALVSRQVKR